MVRTPAVNNQIAASYRSLGASKVTNAKINPGTNSTLKGTASGIVNDIALGTNLSMTGTTLNATRDRKTDA